MGQEFRKHSAEWFFCSFAGWDYWVIFCWWLGSFKILRHVYLSCLPTWWRCLEDWASLDYSLFSYCLSTSLHGFSWRVIGHLIQNLRMTRDQDGSFQFRNSHKIMMLYSVGKALEASLDTRERGIDATTWWRCVTEFGPLRIRHIY